MREFFQSLSLESASLLVAVTCSLATFLISRISPIVVAWLAAVLFPFAVSYCVYWLPVWLGSSDVAQYSAWELLGVGAPFLVGLVLSLLITFFMTRRAKPHV